ncbi:MAG: hypothetical protein ACOY40_16395 [Bacillota bacterium]
MAREERDLYNLDEEDLPEEELDDTVEDEEFDDQIRYHNFYGY